MASRAGTPAPVSADPADTGTTAPRPTWARAERSAISSVMPGPSTAARSSRSSAEVSTSITAGSVSGTGLADAPGDPAASTSVSGKQQRTGARREAAADLGSHPGRVGSLAVDLVDEDRHGTARRRSTRHRTTVCGCTPSTAETTSTAASRTARLRSTSAMKSEWPGVSMRLT